MLWTVVLDKTLESPLDCKEIKPINPKGNQSWIFILRTHAVAETPILRPPDGKNWLIRKDPDAGKDWRQEEKGTTNRGWDGWMASRTQWTWVWVNSGSWWWTGRPGMLQSMGSLRVGHDWATELNWTDSYSRWCVNPTFSNLGEKRKLEWLSSLEPFALQTLLPIHFWMRSAKGVCLPCF